MQNGILSHPQVENLYVITYRDFPAVFNKVSEFIPKLLLLNSNGLIENINCDLIKKSIALKIKK